VRTTDLLTLYRDMRDTIDAIRELTTAIETELASLQIYQDQEAIQRGSPLLKDLAEKTTLLTGTFSICAQRHRQGDSMYAIAQTTCDPSAVATGAEASRHGISPLS
jgi:hypothetical protein